MRKTVTGNSRPGHEGKAQERSMAGRPVLEKTTQGLQTTKRREQRQKASIAACRRSGFDGFEILQILADWHGWQRIVITSAPGITEHTITNDWNRSKSAKKYWPVETPKLVNGKERVAPNVA